jgi:hypothetical protein
VFYKIFGGLVAVVAVVALVSSPTDAANIAAKGALTIGITAGAIVGGVDELISGFQVAKTATQAPAPAPRSNP